MTVHERAQRLNRGLSLHHAGRFDEAQREYAEMLAADPGDFEAAYYGSYAASSQGRLAEALTLAEAACAARGDSVEANVQAGSLLVLLARPEDALPFFERALALAPAHARALNNYAGALRALERYDEALRSYGAAVRIEPGYADAHFNIGAALLVLNRPLEAIPSLERALELDPSHAGAHNSMGSAYWALGDEQRAMGRYETALAIDPGFAEAHANIGNAYGETGRLDEAVAAFSRAAALAPERVDILRHIVTFTRTKPGDAHLTRLEELAALRPESLPVSQRVELHFALGKAYADTGDGRRSFEHLLAGNALKRARTHYDEAAVVQAFADYERAFNAETIVKSWGDGDPSELPVFIIGMPRSGTTLVEQMLSSHPAVYGAGELPLFLTAAQTTIQRFMPPASTAVTLAELDARAWRFLGSTYVAGLRGREAHAERITDKMPSNFQFAGPIALALPGARIIHVRRDPVDTCLSCFTQLFTEDQPWSYDLAETGRFYVAYARLMEHWRAVLPPGHMLEVRYEELVADFEGQARRIVAYCGLPWDEGCLAFYDNPRPVKTASAAQVRRPVYATSVNKAEAGGYADLIGPLLQALTGYI